jgi:hypothetical protein
MFFPGSRYEQAQIVTVIGRDGKPIAAIRVPLAPRTGRLLGFHRRTLGQRLDHLAAHYLGDATAFWRLCDANGAVVPDALAARALVGIPSKG